MVRTLVTTFALALQISLLAGCASAPPPEPRARIATVDPAVQVDAPKRAVPPGTLRREDVLSVISDGPPTFLSRLDVEPVRDRGGRFHGWRVIALRDDLLASGDVKPGDVVTNVNGHAVEDPYQFFDVFQSLVFAKELRLSVERDGTAQELRYPIDDDPNAKPLPRAAPRSAKSEAESPRPVIPPRTTIRIGGDQ